MIDRKIGCRRQAPADARFALPVGPANRGICSVARTTRSAAAGRTKHGVAQPCTVRATHTASAKRISTCSGQRQPRRIDPSEAGGHKCQERLVHSGLIRPRAPLRHVDPAGRPAGTKTDSEHIQPLCGCRSASQCQGARPCGVVGETVCVALDYVIAKNVVHNASAEIPATDQYRTSPAHWMPFSKQELWNNNLEKPGVEIIRLITWVLDQRRRGSSVHTGLVAVSRPSSG